MAYTVLQYGEKIKDIKKCNNVHTPKHTIMHQNKQGREFQILITYLNANDPTP